MKTVIRFSDYILKSAVSTDRKFYYNLTNNLVTVLKNYSK